MTKQRKTMEIPEPYPPRTMGEYEPHHPAGQEPFDSTFGGASTRENLNVPHMEGEDTLSESHRISQLEADNAFLHKRRGELVIERDRYKAALGEYPEGRDVILSGTLAALEKSEADNAALRKLLLRWLRIVNHAKEDGATVADWDKLRQETDAAMREGKKP